MSGRLNDWWHKQKQKKLTDGLTCKLIFFSRLGGKMLPPVTTGQPISIHPLGSRGARPVTSSGQQSVYKVYSVPVYVPGISGPVGT